jgi:hypothetical protein
VVLSIRGAYMLPNGHNGGGTTDGFMQTKKLVLA